MGPVRMRELDLARLGEFEPLQVHLVHQLAVKRNVESSIFHRMFQVAQNILFLRKSQHLSACILQSFSNNDIFHEGFADPGLVDQYSSKISKSLVEES